MEIIKGHPSTSMNDYQLNTTTLIRHAARNFPKQEILFKNSAGVQRYTYRAAYERMMQIANFLEQKLQVKPGDKIGVLDWNSSRHFELYFAIPGIAATLLQMNIRISIEDLAYVANHSEATYIFVDETLLPIAEAIAPLLTHTKGFIIMTDKPLSDIETSLTNIYHFEDEIQQYSPQYDWPVIDETTAFSACYTSGTTGRPKGVYYSHRNIYLHTLYESAWLGLNVTDCVLIIVPMFHSNSWGLVHTAVMMGAKLIFPGRFVAEDTSPLVDLMSNEEVTVTAASPAIFLPMLQYIQTLEEKPDFSRARFLSGATEPPVSLMKGFKELTGAEIIHAYGATETTPLATGNYHLNPNLKNNLSEEEIWDLRRKQGVPVTGLDVKLINLETGEEVPHDGHSFGEVCFRGPWVTGSYHHAPETTDSFIDGYWRSGDVGTIDEFGYMKIVDRMKDVIKSGGEWISSIDLENALIGHPHVMDAAVVGIPHEEWQERPLALVVLREETIVERAEFEELLNKKFAKWQFPDEILVVESIAKTSVGKIDKKAIVTEYHRHYMADEDII